MPVLVRDAVIGAGVPTPDNPEIAVRRNSQGRLDTAFLAHPVNILTRRVITLFVGEVGDLVEDAQRLDGHIRVTVQVVSADFLRQVFQLDPRAYR